MLRAYAIIITKALYLLLGVLYSFCHIGLALLTFYKPGNQLQFYNQVT